MALTGGAAQSETEAMADLVEQMWQRYIRPKVLEELMGHTLSGYKATVEKNNGDSTLKISRPFDCTLLNLNCTPMLSETAQEGDQVLVVTLGDLSNAFVLCKTDMSGLGYVPYSEQGEISELTVDRLSTSRRIRKYILGDTSDDNYIDIQGNATKYITGSVPMANALLCEDGTPILTEDDGLILLEEGNGYAVEQAKNRYGEPLYWQRQPVGHTSDGYPTDANGKQIYTTTGETDWPVMVYRYLELVKMQEAFVQQDGVYQPRIVLGAGDNNGYSRGYIYKELTDLLMRYVSSAGKNVDIKFSDQGFVDALHRRLSSCTIDRATGIVHYTMEGDSDTHVLYFTESGTDEVTFEWPDGHTCEVSIT